MTDGLTPGFQPWRTQPATAAEMGWQRWGVSSSPKIRAALGYRGTLLSWPWAKGEQEAVSLGNSYLAIKTPKRVLLSPVTVIHKNTVKHENAISATS